MTETHAKEYADQGLSPFKISVSLSMQARNLSCVGVQAGELPLKTCGLLLRRSLYIFSGKSTLLLTFLRLLELQSGSIEVDGRDINHVPLDLLRQQCFITITQDPLLLPHESLRFNLDPTELEKNECLVTALAKCGIWQHFQENQTGREEQTVFTADIPGLKDHLVLDRKLSSFRELSAGQCQLFALCRALVKLGSLRDSGTKPVLLLDEVTSLLDPTTESTVHGIIDDEFTKLGHTVIIVSHRLGSLEKYLEPRRDAIIFLADGRLKEFISNIEEQTFHQLGQAS